MTSCRVCLKRGQTMFPLYCEAEKKSGILLCDMLKQFVNIEMKVDDDFPDHICLSCKEALIQSFQFKKLVEETHEKLLYKHTGEVRRKIKFKDLTELKTKLDLKGLVYDAKNLLKYSPLLTSDILKHGGVISCIEIKKVKQRHSPPINEPSSDCDNMEMEYLDEDDFLLSEYSNKRKKVRRKKTMKNSEPIKVIATIKGLDAFMAEEKLRKSLPKKSIPAVKRVRKPPAKKKPRTWDHTQIFTIAEGLANWDIDNALAESNKLKKANLPPKKKEKCVCPVCGILTQSMSVHLLTHAEIKPHNCTQCNKAFSQKALYDMHMKKHNGIKDQICEICGAAFYFTKSVIRHRLIHKGERPFSCHLCPRRFIANCDLTRHLKVHAGYKPFKCNECTMTFNAKHQLNAHIRMHTGEKPYTCELCNVAYTYKVNLNNHVFKVHGFNLKFKSIYKVNSEVLNNLVQLENEERVKKSLPALLEMT